MVIDTDKHVRLSAVTHPFKAERKDLTAPEGLSISEMLVLAGCQERYLPDTIVFVRGEVIPHRFWNRYRPKAGVLVEVRAFPVPRGGGGGGGKNPLRTVLTIAVIAFAAWAGPALASFVSYNFGASFGGALGLKVAGGLLTGVIGGVGLLAVNAIAPVRQPRLAQLTKADGIQDSPTYFVDGARNALRPFSPVPVILGTHRHFPPKGAKEYTEVIGDKQYIRLLFVWGVGPVSIDVNSLKIGETLLSDFEGYQIEHREGYASDQPLTLFPSVVNQDNYSILVDQASSWITRTSQDDADELSVDLTFPQGLVEFDDRGNRVNRQVNVEIEYMLTGTSPAVWQKIDTTDPKFQKTFDDSWMTKSGDDLVSVTFNHSRTSAVRHGIRWSVTRGQYDIRVRRTTADTNSTQIFDEVYLTAVRSITDEDPVNTPYPVAKTALVIQATDQLNNIVDEFNGIITSVVPDYDAGSPSWPEGPSNNPASLFRHVLQGAGSSQAVPDSRIDLTTLAEWHSFCEAKGFKFNMVRDFSSSMWETLADIAAAGRAAPTQIDGKWTVVIEDVKSPVSHITPRNSFDFKAEKYFIQMPHAWRIPFPNENEGYRFDERRVYQDGYNSSNATLFETLELPGVTDPDQVYKMGRFRIAQGILQPERWTFKQDMEYLTYQRGSRVLLTHDVLLIGLKYGRIKSVVLTGSPAVQVAQVVLDDEVAMEAGKNYGISIRNISGQVTKQVTTQPGNTKTLTFTVPVDGVGSPAIAAIAAGDIFGFGLLGQETDDASIISIVPDSNFRAQITAVPYRETVFDSDSETIPTFNTNITPLKSIPAPVIQSVVSDESALSLGPGETLNVRIGISYGALTDEAFGVEPEIRVQLRPSGTMEPYFDAKIDSHQGNHFFIAGVRTGETWDIRMRFVVPGLLPGPWSFISNHTVIGKSTAPQPLSGLTISTFGAQALIRWDRPTELDVLFGGEVVFRHTPELTSPVLAESVTIGTASLARTLYAVLPLKEGTYFAIVYDVAGNKAETVTFVSTKQASVHQFASVTTLDEAPNWLGTKTDVVETSGDLTIDEAASPDVLTGTYEFSTGIDLTIVKRVRLTTRLTVNIFDTSSNIDDRLDNIDDWADFDQSLALGADAYVYVRHTDDDPAGSPAPTWSAWERLDSAEFEARGFEFKLVLTRDSFDFNILVDEMGIDVEEVV